MTTQSISRAPLPQSYSDPEELQSVPEDNVSRAPQSAPAADLRTQERSAPRLDGAGVRLLVQQELAKREQAQCATKIAKAGGACAAAVVSALAASTGVGIAGAILAGGLCGAELADAEACIP
jgi:hypothetical protein